MCSVETWLQLERSATPRTIIVTRRSTKGSLWKYGTIVKRPADVGGRYAVVIASVNACTGERGGRVKAAPAANKVSAALMRPARSRTISRPKRFRVLPRTRRGTGTQGVLVPFDDQPTAGQGRECAARKDQQYEERDITHDEILSTRRVHWQTLRRPGGTVKNDATERSGRRTAAGGRIAIDTPPERE
jgi:hypothetical protein